MSPSFILWFCCRCQTSLNSINASDGCYECNHRRCELCYHESHVDTASPAYWASDTFDFSTKFEFEDIVNDANEADNCKAHDDKSTDKANDDDGCSFQEPDVAFDSLDLLAVTPFSYGASDILYLPVESDAKINIHTKTETDTKMEMEIDTRYVGKGLSENEEVEARKKTIKHKFKKSQEKFKLLESNPPKKQRTYSPYEKQLRDPDSFVFAWERCVLVLFLEFSPRWFGLNYTINVFQGLKNDTRTIMFMTTNELDEEFQEEIQRHVFNMLPDKFHHTTSFHFSAGIIQRLVDMSGSSEDDEDYCEPRDQPKNPFYYFKPTMGDSVGTLGDKNSASTLGPCLKINEKGYWLVNFHPFQSACLEQKELGLKQEVRIIHPALADQNPCNEKKHSSIELGVIETVCDYGLKRTRTSRQSEEDDMDLPPHQVVVDWALSTATDIMPNLVRMQERAHDCQHVTEISDVVSGALVFSNGRSSGFGLGQISVSPAVVSAEENGTACLTREWAVERRKSENDTIVDEYQWTHGGIGIGGDSGAAIIDSKNNRLYGQVWGRNAYSSKSKEPRIAYFTKMIDIFDDIKEQWSQVQDIGLASCNGDEGDEERQTPACLRCYEKQRQEKFNYIKGDKSPNSSLEAKPGSPQASPSPSPDDFPFGETDRFSHGSSLTNLPGGMGSLENTLSPDPGIRQDWVAITGIALIGIAPTGQSNLFCGAPSLRTSLDESDFLEPRDGNSNAEIPNNQQTPKHFLYDERSGSIKLKKQKISPNPPDDSPVVAQSSEDPNT